MNEPTLPTPNFRSLADDCLYRCDQIASCTESKGQITRRFLTPPMQPVHELLTSWMQNAGMEVRVDHAGNLIGMRSSATPVNDSTEQNAIRTLLIGSHLDTVPNAGRYDGILGVVIGLAVVEALGDIALPFEIDVIGFSEEEGIRFQMPYIGSRAIAGTFDHHGLDRIDQDGQTMRSVIEAFGLLPDRIVQASYSPENVIGFIEPHVEQGTVLSSIGSPVGVVDAIAGQSRLLVSFQGQAGHAGTTPMSLRRDPLVTASRWIAEVSDYANGVNDLRATIGFVSVAPNVRNVIPGRVELSVDIRHADDSIRLEAIKHLCMRATEMSAENGIDFEIIEQDSHSATAMDSDLTAELAAAIDDSQIKSVSMVSGAGHDAVVMAEKFPTAMLFLRQLSGISHHPDEDVDKSDVAVCIEVLTRFVDRLKRQHS